MSDVKTVPDPALKGEYNGNCNRTDCQKPGAVFYNYSTRKFYCVTCAGKINHLNRADAMRLFGHELCKFLTQEEVNAL